MSNDVITVRLPQKHAAFLQANLSALVAATREAMTRPGLAAQRRTALGARAALLETIEDAVHGALLEVPRDARQGLDLTELGQALQAAGRLSAA